MIIQDVWRAGNKTEASGLQAIPQVAVQQLGGIEEAASESCGVPEQGRSAEPKTKGGPEDCMRAPVRGQASASGKRSVVLSARTNPVSVLVDRARTAAHGLLALA